jgi:hypothetical protein
VFCDANVDYCASHFHSFSKDKLRRLDKKTLHDLLSSPSLAIESEDDLLGALVELGSAYFEFWRYIETVFLTDKGLSLFVDKLPFDELTKEIWPQVTLRRKGVSKGEHRRHGCRDCLVPFQSTILSGFPSRLTEFGQKQWKLLYRGRMMALKVRISIANVILTRIRSRLHRRQKDLSSVVSLPSRGI